MTDPRAARAAVLVLGLVIAAGLVGCEDKLILAPRLSKGAQYRFDMTTSMSTTQEFEGQKHTTEQHTVLGVHQECTGVEDNGSMTMRWVYESVKHRAKGPMGEQSFDSDTPPDSADPLVGVFSNMVGTAITMKLTKKGKIEEVAFREMMHPFTAFYPGHPVAVGDLWTSVVSVSRPFPMRLTTHYTLEERKDGTALISLRGTFEPAGGGGGISLGPAKLQGEIRGTQTGTIKVEEATGWMIGADLEQEMSGKLRMTRPGADTVEGPMQVDNVIRVERRT